MASEAPAVNRIKPPVCTVASPAVPNRSPPTILVDVPLPTTNLMSPPFPPVAAPVVTEMDPDDPELVVPDENESLPLTPASPAFLL